MKIEMKNVQTVPRLSAETICFAADLLVDGVKVGKVSNRGNGDSNRLEISNPEIRHKVLQHIKSQPPYVQDGQSYPMDADLFLAIMLDEHLAKKRQRSSHRDLHKS